MKLKRNDYKRPGLVPRHHDARPCQTSISIPELAGRVLDPEELILHLLEETDQDKNLIVAYAANE